jgi:pumilio family protein 6
MKTTTQLAAKKRPAQSQKSNASAKKARIVPSRPQPVTRDDDSESESDVEGFAGDEEEEEEDLGEDPVDEDNAEEVRQEPKQSGMLLTCGLKLSLTPLAARESHIQQKAVQQQRKAAKRHADILAEAKKHWAQVRQTDLTKDQRQKHVRLLMDAVRGNVQDIVFKHDASRIIQSVCLRYRLRV